MRTGRRKSLLEGALLDWEETKRRWMEKFRVYAQEKGRRHSMPAVDDPNVVPAWFEAEHETLSNECTYTLM